MTRVLAQAHVHVHIHILTLFHSGLPGKTLRGPPKFKMEIVHSQET
jgi:hypothetical protein